MLVGISPEWFQKKDIPDSESIVLQVEKAEYLTNKALDIIMFIVIILDTQKIKRNILHVAQFVTKPTFPALCEIQRPFPTSWTSLRFEWYLLSQNNLRKRMSFSNKIVTYNFYLHLYFYRFSGLAAITFRFERLIERRSFIVNNNLSLREC